MRSEMSCVERVRMVWTTCGRNATVVRNAAASPTISVCILVPNLALRATVPRFARDGNLAAMTHYEFLETVQRNPFNRVILERLPLLALRDCWLVSGGLFQTVWNMRTGQRPDLHIKDYDIFYFDPDTSYAAEDAVIRRAADLF